MNPVLDKLKTVRNQWGTLIEQRSENNTLSESESDKLDRQIAYYESRFGNISNLDETIATLKKEMENNNKKNKSMEVKEDIQKPRGRAAALVSYMAANPDLQEEPDDDTLHDFHGSRYSDLEGRYSELENSHRELGDANSRLAEQVSKDPRLAAVLSLIAGENPKSLPYAIAMVYGKDHLNMEGKDLEEFEAGYQENLKRLAESEQLQAQENIKGYEETMSKYTKEHGLTEEQETEIHSGIMKYAENLLMGIVPVELIDIVYKGLNYDKDMQQAADTGFVEGRNDSIDAKLRNSTYRPVPDLGNTTGAGSPAPVIPHRGLGSPRG